MLTSRAHQPLAECLKLVRAASALANVVVVVLLILCLACPPACWTSPKVCPECAQKTHTLRTCCLFCALNGPPFSQLHLQPAVFVCFINLWVLATQRRRCASARARSQPTTTTTTTTTTTSANQTPVHENNLLPLHPNNFLHLPGAC